MTRRYLSNAAQRFAEDAFCSSLRISAFSATLRSISASEHTPLGIFFSFLFRALPGRSSLPSLLFVHVCLSEQVQVLVLVIVFVLVQRSEEELSDGILLLMCHPFEVTW